MNIRNNTAGFTLVELMVALVAGLIVTGAVLAFTMSSLRANSDFVSSTRLTQELRNSLNFITDDLRRAGYDENALDFVSRPSNYPNVSEFAQIFINTDNDCVIYAYDRLPGTPGGLPELANGEIRAIRRAVASIDGVDVGVLELAESAAGVTPACNGGSPDYSVYPASCNASSGWCPLTDPRILNVQTFVVQNDQGATQVGSGATLGMQIRGINVQVVGALKGQEAQVVRGMRAHVRVRTDCVRNNADTRCTQAPTGV